MFTYELIAMWVAITLYAASGSLYAIGLAFSKEKSLIWGDRLALAGLVVHAVGIAIRWTRVGHGPYLGFYEVSSLMAFLSVAFFLFLVWKYPGLRVAGILIMFVTFLIMGGSLLVSKDARELTGSLASYWLVIHVAFANLAYGSYAAAFVLSGAYLLREYGHDHQARWENVLAKLPAQEIIDGLTFRFVGAGFIFQGVMIASGAIWANEAWGRYWAWDPMETWSLIAWAVYAIYLHLTLTLGWRGKRAAWVAVMCLPVIVFSLLGVPIAYKSIHGAYLAL